MLDVENIRNNFPMLKHHPELIYFDNGATTLKPQCVIDTITHYYEYESVNVHRGDYDISADVSTKYDQVREIVAGFINCDPLEVVYTHGATDGLNIIAYGYARHIHKGDVILTTEYEHASSILPWMRVAKEKGAAIEYLPLSGDRKIMLDELKKRMNDKVKVVVIAAVSNVLGVVQPVRKISDIVHQYDALLVVDGAQSVPHIKTDVKRDNIDFLAFSAHKMCGPTGVGILYGKKALLEDLEPLELGGGSNARFNRHGDLILKDAPEKFEAGTPPIEQILSLGTAIEYLEKIGMENIEAREEELRVYMIEKMSKLTNITMYNPMAESAIIAFNVNGIFAQDAASYLNTQHVAVRSGNHCAKILPDIIGVTETIRASLYFYNTKEEIDRFVEAVASCTIEKCIDIFL